MSKVTEATGSCLCGKIKVQTPSLSTNVGACHCNTCRKWAGGPFLSVDCGTTVKFSAKELITSFSSSEWAERGFCSQCGTHLFYKLKQTGQYIIPIGLFNISSELTFDHQIFIEEKPSYYSFANQTTQLTGAEVFAQFSEK